MALQGGAAASKVDGLENIHRIDVDSHTAADFLAICQRRLHGHPHGRSLLPFQK
jgi:hypothetical protein